MIAMTDIVVLGAGESGVSAARLARREGLGVFVSDAGAGNPKYLAELDAAGIDYETGGHTDRIYRSKLVVKSPGIPDTALTVVELRNAGVKVISEIEFAYRFVDPAAKIVGITGSNGKTTTTLLTEKLLEFGGLRVKAGGNLGDSFARLLLEEETQEVYVLELSSFQLDGISTFRPDVACLLNITPDHLDRYEYNLATYAAAKVRLAMNMRPEDTLFALADSQTIAPAFAQKRPDTEIYYLNPTEVIEGEKIIIEDYAFDLATTQLTGRHNALNAAFAVAVALTMGLKKDTIQLALNDFVPAAHRMELVRTKDDRRWINDSKATNVDAVYFALEAMEGPTVWLAGGTDKGNDYDVLTELVIDKVHTLIAIGEDNRKLQEAFADRVDTYVEAANMAEAVTLADRHARPHDRVLLSPACASFDRFKNYIDRGDQFRRAAKTVAL